MPDHLDPLPDGAFVGCRAMCGVGNEPLLHLDDQRRLRGRKASIQNAFHQCDVKAIPVVSSRRTGPSASGTVDVMGLLESFDFRGGDQDAGPCLTAGEIIRRFYV